MRDSTTSDLARILSNIDSTKEMEQYLETLNRVNGFDLEDLARRIEAL